MAWRKWSLFQPCPVKICHVRLLMLRPRLPTCLDVRARNFRTVVKGIPRSTVDGAPLLRTPRRALYKLPYFSPLTACASRFPHREVFRVQLVQFNLPSSGDAATTAIWITITSPRHFRNGPERLECDFCSHISGALGDLYLIGIELDGFVVISSEYFEKYKYFFD